MNNIISRLVRDFLYVIYSMIYLGIYMIAISLLTFIYFGIDKYKSKRGMRRISENTLLIFVMLGGVLGALGAMEIFRHKTVKAGFLLKFWSIVIVQIVVGVLVFLYMLGIDNIVGSSLL